MPDMPRHPNARGSGAPPRDQPTGRRAWWVYALGVALVALLGMVIVPARAEWAQFFAELVAAQRACAMHSFWIAAERLDLVRRACPGAQFTPHIEAPALTRVLPESLGLRDDHRHIGELNFAAAFI